MQKTFVRRALALTALTTASLGALSLGAGPAHAQQRRGVVFELPTYQLTPTEKANACGTFIGTIVYSDHTSLDCSTGIATLAS